MAKQAKKKLWGGRFAQRTDALVERYSSSIGTDYRLAKYDVVGSIAHAKMLGACRIISGTESAALVRGLTKILKDIEQGRWAPDPDAEDVHSQIQQQLNRIAGPAAAKLHTARSRNDQVALDLRLYAREAVSELGESVIALQRTLVGLAAAHQDAVIPGYTHLQQAQPVLAAHHLLAYVEMLERDGERLASAYERIDVLPLGSGALAGTSLPIDRTKVAKLLGFSRVSENSMDAVSDRDFAAELLFTLSLMGVHLSRLGEDLVFWASQECGVLEMDDAVATGSSLMPQKKNPDVPELVRGQAGLILGDLVALLTVLKGLPLSYNRDLQWDKRCVFRSVELSLAGLRVMARFLSHVRLRPGRGRELLASGTTSATDLAEYLVQRGVAFAEAHGIVGRLVVQAERSKTPLSRMTTAQLRAFSPHFGPEAARLTDPAASVARKRSTGSTNPAQVRKAIAGWKQRLK